MSAPKQQYKGIAVARQRVEYLDMLRLPRRPQLDRGLPLGVVAAPLSEDTTTGAISWLASVAPQWQRIEAGAFKSDLELLVVAGDLAIGEHRLTRGGYSFLPTGAWHGPMRSEKGCQVLLMFDGEPNFSAAESHADSVLDDARIERLDTLAMPWEPVPEFPGRSRAAAGGGLHTKMIRTESDSGAYTLLVRQAPGWNEPKLEAHDCWEELILMEGDYLMGSNGLVAAGTYIFRPEGIPHGPQATRTGSVWLGRGNKTIDFQFSQTSWADGAISDYLAAPLDDSQLIRTPWGVWSQ
jgi:hypothetical protein